MNELLIPSLAVFVAFFVQSNTGFGAGLISIPLLLVSMGFVEAAGVMGPLFLLFSILMLKKTWKDVDKRIFLELGISGLIGLVLGTFFLVQFGEAEWMKPVMGVFVLSYVAMNFMKKNRLSMFNQLGPLFGLLGGITSGLFAAGGHFFVMYANSKLSNMDRLRATIIAALALNNVIRVPLHVYGEVITVETIKTSAWLLPSFVLGILAGQAMYDRVNKRLIKELVIGLLFVIGVKLLVS